jgi:bacteriocin biosynthesis cyclodehydratase domain-containing protein
VTARRPRLALPYTVLGEDEQVLLVAGEDHRYALKGPGLGSWLPGLLDQMNGRRSVDELTASLSGEQRKTATAAIERLYGERVLVDGTAAEAHAPDGYRLAVEGQNPLAEALRAAASEQAGEALPVLCQDTLDFAEASRFNARCAQSAGPWLWVTSGPLSRGYVSPVFLPDAGPCLDCLVRHFQRLSPAPEVYGQLREHVARGGAIAPATFPAPGLAVLAQLACWKAARLREEVPPAALYRLHVLEADSLEVAAHRVFADPECSHGHGPL